MSGGKWTGPAVHARALEEDGYLTLKGLHEYSSLSVRTLQRACVDPIHPLPHFKLPNKILVRKSDFDAWVQRFKVDATPRRQRLDVIVDDVLASLRH